MELSIRALRAWTEFAAEDPAEANLRPTPEDAEVDQVMVEFGGDFRSAISALLHDLAILAGDFTACVSRGYVKGRRPEKHRPHARETRLEERA